MNRSDSIAKLADALSKAQAAIEPATKNASIAHLKSKYADLLSYLQAAKEPLGKNGLAIVQSFAITETGQVLETTLMHTSGEWIQSQLLMPPAGNSPGLNPAQALGSQISYYRRYSFAAILGMGAEDDDAATAPTTTAAKPATAPAPRPPVVTPEPAPKPALSDEIKPTLSDEIKAARDEFRSEAIARGQAEWMTTNAKLAKLIDDVAPGLEGKPSAQFTAADWKVATAALVFAFDEAVTAA